MRELTFEEIRSAARGIVGAEQKEGGIHFYRFRPAQAAHYEKARPDFYLKALATAGVRLSFITDSTALEMDYIIENYGSSRKFAYFDIYINDVLTYHFGISERTGAQNREELLLAAGEKKIEIHFPWSACAVLQSLRLSSNASFAPLKRKTTMLSYGDSITQGYDALYPSLSYASALAKMMDADSINRGIGGEIFRPELLNEKEDFEPDYITVAYGTNDWACRSAEKFIENCRAFYALLSEQYPYARIFAITPLWRKDGEEEKPIGIPHCQLDALMRSLLADLPNVAVIGGYPLTPHLPEFFSDLYLHPNHLGFTQYAKNLYEAIR